MKLKTQAEEVERLRQRCAMLESDNDHLDDLYGRQAESALEVIVEKDKRIVELEQALSKLIDIASQCDSWQSFPWLALEDANEALLGCSNE